MGLYHPECRSVVYRAEGFLFGYELPRLSSSDIRLSLFNDTVDKRIAPFSGTLELSFGSDVEFDHGPVLEHNVVCEVVERIGCRFPLGVVRHYHQYIDVACEAVSGTPNSRTKYV